MTKEIVFTNFGNFNVSENYLPKPSSNYLPEWYKKTQSYYPDNKKNMGFDGNQNSSIKKCIPVFDTLTSGYIIPTYCDLWIKRTENGDIVYMTSSELDIAFHPVAQAPYHPKMNNHPYPKWINPWSIKTPAGYSSLFIPPVHGGNEYFTIAEGIVDTDTYKAPVNFPFILNDVNFEGLIPAGTPMVQVIPFKRDSWQSKIGSDKDLKKIIKDSNYLSSQFFDRYKKMFWQRKNFK